MKNNSSAYDYMFMNEWKIIKLNKYLKKLIIEDIDNFFIKLGEGFCYIKNEYKLN